MFKRLTTIAIFLLVSLSIGVFANNNETVDTILNIHGNIPNSTIFFAVDGSEDYESIMLEPNQTTLLSCWGTAFDLDGMDDLNNLTAVIYSDSVNRFGDENLSVLYRNDTCDTTNLKTTGDWNCTFSVQYFAEPTDWTCIINLTNMDLEFYNDTINTTSIVEDLVALEVHNKTIDFGTRAVGEEYDAETEVLFYNTGNVVLDLMLDAFNRSSTFIDDSTQSFNCSIGSIPVENLRFSLTPSNPYDDPGSIPMNATGATDSQPVGLAPQFGGSGSLLPTSESTYWAIGIPMNIAGVCTGHIMYIGLSA